MGYWVGAWCFVERGAARWWCGTFGLQTATWIEMAAQAESLDERVAYQVLSRALEEPTRTILRMAATIPV